MFRARLLLLSVFCLLLSAPSSAAADYYQGDQTVLKTVDTANAGGGLKWAETPSKPVSWKGVTWAGFSGTNRTTKLTFGNSPVLRGNMDLRGLDRLRELTVNADYLTSLDVSRNPELAKIILKDVYNLTGLNLGNNTALTHLELAAYNLPNLNVRNNTALTYLDVASDALDNVDLSNNTRLKSLAIKGMMPSLDLRNNTALENLQVEGWYLTSLDLSQNMALSKLEVSGNRLTRLDLSKNTTLKELSLYSTGLTSLDLSHNTALTKLSFGSSDDLHFLDLSKNTALRELALDNIALIDLDLSRNTDLSKLSINGYKSTSLDLSKNTALKELTLYNDGLTGLDLSHNTALAKLDLHNVDALHALDLSKNIALKELGLFNVVLTGLDLSHNTALTKLSLAILNDVPTVDLHRNTALRTLELYDVSFPSLDLSNNTALEELNVSSAHALTSLDLSKNAALETLNLSHNTSLHAIDLRANTALKALTVWSGNNGLRNLDLSGNAALENLNLGISDLAVLDLDKNTGLKNLSIYNSKLGSLDLSKNTALEELYLTSNHNLTGLDLSKNTALSVLELGSASRLTSLDLSRNTELTDLEIYSANLASLDLRGNSALESLELNSVPLSALDITKNTALEKISIAFMDLPDLDVSKNTKLIQLSVVGNPLKTLDLTGNTALEYLRIRHSPDLAQLDLRNNIALHFLNLDSTGVTDLDLSKNTALETLSIQYAPLSALDLSQNTVLSYLSIDGTELANLDLSENTKLTHVTLTNNKLSSLTIGENPRLSLLSAGFNNLAGLDLRGAPQLETLNVQGNRLRNLRLPSDLRNLSVLNVDANHLTLSQLKPFMAVENVDFGVQTDALPGQTILAGQTYTVPAREMIIDGTATRFSIDGTEIEPNEEGVVLSMPGTYALLMTNADIYSKGYVPEGAGDLTHNPLAEVYTGKITVIGDGSGPDPGPGILERAAVSPNAARAGRAIDAAMQKGLILDGAMNTALEPALAGKDAAALNQLHGEVLAASMESVRNGAAKPFARFLRARAGDFASSGTGWSLSASVNGLGGLGGMNGLGLDTASLDPAKLDGAEREAAQRRAALSSFPTASGPSGSWGGSVTPVGRYGHRSSGDGYTGYDMYSTGAYLTMDHRFEDVIIGASFGYGHTWMDFDKHNSKSDADTYSLGLFTGWKKGGFSLTGQINGGWANVDTTRKIPAASLKAEGDYSMWWAGFGLGAAYAFDLSGWMLTPSLSFDYMRSESEAFTEKKAQNLRLRASSEEHNSAEVTALVELARNFQTGSATLRPSLNAGVAVALADTRSEVKTRFVEVPRIGSFKSRGYADDETAFLGGAGLAVKAGDAFTVNADYNLLARDKYQEHGLRLGFVLRF